MKWSYKNSYNKSESIIIICFAVVIISLFAGYSTTYYVKPFLKSPVEDTLNFANFQKWVEGSSLKVVLKNGQTFDARLIRIETDSAYFNNKPSNSKNAVSTKDISIIESRDHNKGGAIGLLSGIVIGTASGWVIGSLTSTGDMEDLGVVLSTITGGLLGGGLGIIIGIAIGSPEIYEFKN